MKGWKKNPPAGQHPPLIKGGIKGRILLKSRGDSVNRPVIGCGPTLGRFFESYKVMLPNIIILLSKKYLLFMLILLILFACGIEEDAGFAVVRELRVAVVLAEPAEPVPGGIVHLRAIGVDPESRELAFLWFNPPEVVDPKEGIPHGIQPIAFTSEFDWTAPETEGTYTLIVVVVPVEFLSELAGAQDFNNISNIPHALAFKNINVTASTARNHNPLIEDVLVDPSEFAPGDTINLRAVANDPDGDELQYAWLSIIPGLSSDYENPVEFRSPEDGSPVEIYLVVRDGRGGSSIKVIEIN